MSRSPLSKRIQLDEKFYIDVDGEPFEFARVGTLHWVALSKLYPALSRLLDGKSIDDLTVTKEDEIAMQADVIAIGICGAAGLLGDKSAGIEPDAEAIEETVELAKRMAPVEREEAFTQILIHSQPKFKRFFTEAVSLAAQKEEEEAKAKASGVLPGLPGNPDPST